MNPVYNDNCWGKMGKSAKGRNVLSVLLTLLVVGIYLIPNFASAVTVNIQTDKPSYENSEIIRFDVSVDIEDGERIPVQNLTLKINDTLKTCTFLPDGTFLTGCSNMNIISQSVFTAGYGYGYNYGYGYGYGTTFETVNTSFGYGYGYGPGYGYGEGLSFPSELSYTIEWNIGKDNITKGNFEANLEAYAKKDDNTFIYTQRNLIAFSVTGDNVVGNVSDVKTSIPSLTLIINGSTNLSQGFSDLLPVNFSDSVNTIVEFEWNFSNPDLNLLLSNITINETFVNGSNKVVISGIDLTSLGLTKTAYLNQTNTSLNGVCIKDEEILSISEMTNDCSDPSEVKVECNGVAQSGFICTDLGTRLKIEGLEHSGIGQISYTVPTAPTPTPSPEGGPTGGGGGGGGGGLPFTCNMDWECSDWSECIDEKQTRTCNFVKVPQHASGTRCPSKDNPPETSRSCEIPEEVPEEEVPTEEVAPEAVTPPTGPGALARITGAVGAVTGKLFATKERNLFLDFSMIVVIIVVGGLFLFSQFYGGMPGADHFTRAANFHKRAENAHKKGKREKSEKLHKKAQTLREKGEKIIFRGS